MILLQEIKTQVNHEFATDNTAGWYLYHVVWFPIFSLCSCGYWVERTCLRLKWHKQSIYSSLYVCLFACLSKEITKILSKAWLMILVDSLSYSRLLISLDRQNDKTDIWKNQNVLNLNIISSIHILSIVSLTFVFFFMLCQNLISLEE
jgi:hypothetical protein